MKTCHQSIPCVCFFVALGVLAGGYQAVAQEATAEPASPQQRESNLAVEKQAAQARLRERVKRQYDLAQEARQVIEKMEALGEGQPAETSELRERLEQLEARLRQTFEPQTLNRPVARAATADQPMLQRRTEAPGFPGQTIQGLPGAAMSPTAPRALNRAPRAANPEIQQLRQELQEFHRQLSERLDQLEVRMRGVSAPPSNPSPWAGGGFGSWTAPNPALGPSPAPGGATPYGWGQPGAAPTVAPLAPVPPAPRSFIAQQLGQDVQELNRQIVELRAELRTLLNRLRSEKN